ncbi:unnamed protein product [marine sediment metagenome]|uniref:Integration host factor subunit alpha n=1 Tax=marine sediment metagenome TaxID=412755 RepID=X0WAH2_9ZZZZ
MTKAHLGKIVSEKSFSKKDATDFVELLSRILKDTLKSGEMVKISGFVNFVVREKKARSGRDPQTGDTITITPRRLLTFKPSNILNDAIN